MSIRLNGWQRIGVILSFLWTIFVCGYAVFEYYSDPSFGRGYFVEVQPEQPRTISPEEALAPREPHLRVGRLIAALVAPLIAACENSVSNRGQTTIVPN